MYEKLKTKGRRDIEDEMRRLFSGFAQMRHRAMLNAINVWHPATDVYETEDELIVVCELAGLDKSEVKVTIDNAVLTISGIRDEKKVVGKTVFHNLEINYGPFERNIQLPDRFIGSEPKALYSNGILTVKIPVGETRLTHNIEIESS